MRGFYGNGIQVCFSQAKKCTQFLQDDTQPTAQPVAIDGPAHTLNVAHMRTKSIPYIAINVQNYGMNLIDNVNLIMKFGLTLKCKMLKCVEEKIILITIKMCCKLMRRSWHT